MKSTPIEQGAERLEAVVLGDGAGLARSPGNSLRGRLRLRERSKDLFRQWKKVRGPELKVMTPLALAEDLLHYMAALMLVLIGVLLMFRASRDLPPVSKTFWHSVPSAINDVLLVVIVLEIFRTVFAHFGKDGVSAEKFLVIGVISAVRHLLTVGAALSSERVTTEMFNRDMVELGVNGFIVVGLVVGIWLLRRGESQAGL
jgi:uncharacterized membrane protein (DUF373 family)